MDTVVLNSGSNNKRQLILMLETEFPDPGYITTINLVKGFDVLGIFILFSVILVTLNIVIERNDF